MPDLHSLPLYLRISESLIRDIQAGRLLDGERLAPEREMARTLGTSVGTLRKALAELEKRGLLHRIQGSGNYVRHRPDATSLYGMFRLELLEGGGLPTAEVISVDRLAKPADAPAFGTVEHGYRIRRLRRLAGIPAAMEEIWLDGRHARAIRVEDLSESLYYFYRERLGLAIVRAEDRVGVGAVPGWRPGAFGPGVGQPVGMIERIAWAEDGTSAEFSRTWFDSDKARYTIRLR